MKRTVIYLDIEEEDMYSGIEAISFVDEPAIQMDWHTYSKDKKPMKFARNEVNRIITSPVMLAETEIYRYSEEMGEYYVKYSADSIRKMRNKFHMDGRQNQVNEDHDSKRKVENVYMVESFIVGDKVKSEIFDIPDGSWVASWYVKDEDYWNKVVMSDEFNGVSLEGYFVENYEMKKTEAIFNAMREILNSNVHDVVKTQRLRNLFRKE